MYHRLAAVACACLVLWGCGGGDDDSATTFTEPGTSFRVEVGERFEVVLESNASTGFAWELSGDLDGDVVTLISDSYEAPDGDLVGAPGTQRLVFEAVGEGSTSIELWYVRSFDDPVEPADRARFEVVADP